MAYSMDYRSAAVAYKQNGHTFKQLQQAFKIPPETYYQWMERFENGYYETKTKQLRSGKIDKEQLNRAVAEHPDAFLRELAEPFGCTPEAVFYILKDMNITLKKRLLPIRKNQKRSVRSLQR
jgi:transposase